MDRNVVGWFEIPVVDITRAKQFYESVLGVTLEEHDMGYALMAWFPMHDKLPGATGTLIKGKGYVPSHEGSLVYFSSSHGDVAVEQGRVVKAGGRVLREKFSIGDHGHVALIEDTEGNRVALHSRQ